MKVWVFLNILFLLFWQVPGATQIQNAPVAPNDSIITARVLEYSILNSTLEGIKPEQILYSLRVLVISFQSVNGKANFTQLKVNQVIKVYSKEMLSPVLFGKIIEANVSFSGDEKGGKYWITNIEMIEKSITSLEFDTIEKGFFSGITEKKNLVIRTQDQRAKLWNKHTSIRIPPPEAPAIDFTENMILAVFMGQKPSGGFAVEITRVEKCKNGLVIFFSEVEPPLDAVVTAVLTQPYHIIKIEKSNLLVKFKKSEEEKGCLLDKAERMERRGRG